MSVAVRSRGGPHQVSSSTIRTRASRMLARIDRAEAELTVVLVDDETMRSLNAQWRGKNATTDVLSFPMGEGEYGDVNPQLLGDVVISVPTAQRQADRLRRALADEITFLLAHGLLHLVGHDHQTATQNREMMRLTRELVSESTAKRAKRPGK